MAGGSGDPSVSAVPTRKTEGLSSRRAAQIYLFHLEAEKNEGRSQFKSFNFLVSEWYFYAAEIEASLRALCGFKHLLLYATSVGPRLFHHLSLHFYFILKCSRYSLLIVTSLPLPSHFALPLLSAAAWHTSATVWAECHQHTQQKKASENYLTLFLRVRSQELLATGS